MRDQLESFSFPNAVVSVRNLNKKRYYYLMSYLCTLSIVNI